MTARIVKNATTNAVISTETFTYDAAGNITDAPESCFAYDTNNRLTVFCGQNVSYDLDGNMLSCGSLSCTYDSANRLITAGGHNYTYNAEVVRIPNLCADANTTYTYDTNCKLSKLLCKTTNGITTKYVYGRGLIGEEKCGEFKTYHFDKRGSTVALTDTNGNITDTFKYDTYGKLIERTGESFIIFGYNGRDGVVTDKNGLIYMRARYYSPDMKRFINADIIRGKINNAVTLNRYAFANTNPVTNVDPLGFAPNMIVQQCTADGDVGTWRNPYTSSYSNTNNTSNSANSTNSTNQSTNNNQSTPLSEQLENHLFNINNTNQLTLAFPGAVEIVLDSWDDASLEVGTDEKVVLAEINNTQVYLKFIGSTTVLNTDDYNWVYDIDSKGTSDFITQKLIIKPSSISVGMEFDDGTEALLEAGVNYEDSEAAFYAYAEYSVTHTIGDITTGIAIGVQNKTNNQTNNSYVYDSTSTQRAKHGVHGVIITTSVVVAGVVITSALNQATQGTGFKQVRAVK